MSAVLTTAFFGVVLLQLAALLAWNQKNHQNAFFVELGEDADLKEKVNNDLLKMDTFSTC